MERQNDGVSRLSIAVFTAAVLGAAACTADTTSGSASEPSTSIVATAPATTADDSSNNGATDDPEPSSADDAATGTVVARTMPLTGNRYYEGTADLTEPDVFNAGVDDPAWILGAPTGDDVAWTVGTADDGPFELVDTTESNPTRQAVDALLTVSENHVPDTRLVSDGAVTVELVDPTDRYPHGALGDDIEAATIRITTNDVTIDVRLAERDVVEGTAAMLADLDDDGTPEVIVTLANATDGARLAAFDLDGALVAESDPIGQGNRWRHQIAVGPTGLNGETELVVVRTPHIGGIVEWFRLVDGRLELVGRYPAEGSGSVTSHPIGTINLDLAAVLDADTDGQLELVIPSQDRTQLLVIGRTVDGGQIEQTHDLPAEIDSNLAVVELDQAKLALAVATRDGSVTVWK